jgi:hypothetical protein
MPLPKLNKGKYKQTRAQRDYLPRTEGFEILRLVSATHNEQAYNGAVAAFQFRVIETGRPKSECEPGKVYSLTIKTGESGFKGDKNGEELVQLLGAFSGQETERRTVVDPQDEDRTIEVDAMPDDWDPTVQFSTFSELGENLESCNFVAKRTVRRKPAFEGKGADRKPKLDKQTNQQIVYSNNYYDAVDRDAYPLEAAAE